MVSQLQKCQRATDGLVSCADWCYGMPEAEPPSHVCYWVLVDSIRHYIAAHLGLKELDVGHSLKWPTPMGVQELRTWYEEQVALRDLEFPYVTDEFHERWDKVFAGGPPPSEDDERLRLFDDFPAEKVAAFQRWSCGMVFPSPPIPPVWGAPPVTVPHGEYWLGLVVRRPVDDSTLWLLGLLGRPTAEEFHGENWFKWIHPVLQIESRATKTSEISVLNRQSRLLLNWYNITVLGHAIHKGGALGYFDTPSEFIDALEKAVADLTRNYEPVTQKKVAGRIPIAVETLKYNLKRLDPPLEWKQARNLKKLRQYIPGPHWK